jgi:hypothetical protein
MKTLLFLATFIIIMFVAMTGNLESALQRYDYGLPPSMRPPEFEDLQPPFLNQFYDPLGTNRQRFVSECSDNVIHRTRTCIHYMNRRPVGRTECKLKLSGEVEKCKTYENY